MEYLTSCSGSSPPGAMFRSTCSVSVTNTMRRLAYPVFSCSHAVPNPMIISTTHTNNRAPTLFACFIRVFLLAYHVVMASRNNTTELAVLLHFQTKRG